MIFFRLCTNTRSSGCSLLQSVSIGHLRHWGWWPAKFKPDSCIGLCNTHKLCLLKFGRWFVKWRQLLSQITQIVPFINCAFRSRPLWPRSRQKNNTRSYWIWNMQWVGLRVRSWCVNSLTSWNSVFHCTLYFSFISRDVEKKGVLPKGGDSVQVRQVFSPRFCAMQKRIIIQWLPAYRSPSIPTSGSTWWEHSRTYVLKYSRVFFENRPKV